jgi:hypothetical protein
MNLLYGRRLAMLAAACGVVAAGCVSSTLATAPAPSVPNPPPPINRWISPVTGSFTVPAWDDRELSDEQKRAKPLLPDPRWTPLAECMTARGFETRADPSLAFSQQDLDHLVAAVNAAQPDTQANKQLGAKAAALPGIAGAFVQCADQSLAIPVSEFAAHGWVVPPFPD